MSFKRGLIQLWGFIVKSFLQRWRTPVLTILEIIMPCVFVILLSIVYWTATDTVIPASENNNAVAMNESAILWHLICQPPHASMTIIKELAFTNLVTSPNYPGQTAICDPTYDEFRCATYIGSGHDICVQSSEYSNIFAGSMYAAYYGSGSMGPDALEYYLILSAYLTEESNNLNPTFFGRGGKASYSHFGHILLASDDPALANEFIAHASSLSQVVASVIYPTVFSSYEAAEDYALANGNTVFAIVDLPSSSVQKTDINDPPVFTIGMNYSATAATYQESNRKKVLSRDWDSSEGYPLYRASGFLSLQTFVQSFYLQRYLKDTTKTQTGPAVYTGTAGIGSFLTSTGTPALIPLPSPERYENSFLSQWAYYMPLIAVMAVLFPVARLTGFIVEEKSLKIREAMLIMGLYPECNFGGWFTTTTVMNFVAALLASMILKIGFLKVVNYGVLLVLYFTFLQQCSAFAMALSTIFTNPRIAVWIAALIIFVCGIPYYTFPDGMSDVAKMFCCLVPCIGYGLSLNDMISFASFHKHYGWSEARIGGFNTAIAIGFMWFGWGVLIILTLYLDRVSPACVGVREHPLFFLKPLIRCFHKPKRETVYMSGRKHAAESGNPYNDDKEEEMGCVEDDVNEKLLTDKHDPYASWMEHYNEPLSPDNPDIAVLVSNLKKKYFAGGILGFLYTYFTGVFRKGDQVIALDDVTFAMRRGEISILLGPNGAGKSTVMGIATGLIRQTSGNVFIRGMDTKWEMGKCRQNIGYCPQEDIIWDTLTVIEHLRFYARLKDSNTFGVTDAATKAMELAGLAHKRNCKAKDLSGGQKRRLCVAIALVGDSSVLFLDEPTAGMDMIGRKSVYELLQKTRENRSTLISTHLLDEADRIGDRILIINHGNVVAEGSSLFLKSKADSGYTLTCLIDSGLSPEEENLAIANLNDYMREKTYPQHREPIDLAPVPDTCMLKGVERRGREMNYLFSMEFITANGGQFISELQSNKDKLKLRTVSLSLTTLENVFLKLMDSASLRSAVDEVNAAQGTAIGEVKQQEEEEESVFYDNSNGFVVFWRHFRALMLKRLHFAKRDFKLLLFQVIIPVGFLLLSLLVNLVQGIKQPALVLDMSMYDDPVSEVPFTYGFDDAGFPPYSPAIKNAFAVSASVPDEAFGRRYAARYIPATSYIPTTEANSSVAISNALVDELTDYPLQRYIALSPSQAVTRSSLTMGGSVLMHNMSFPHAAPQALNALWNLASFQIFGPGSPIPIAKNRPMYFGEFEKDLYDSSKQVLLGIFAIIPFLFIPCNQIAYIVREKETGARHMQWLSGASTVAYWSSCFVFDLACYVVTIILSYIVFIIFDRTEFTNEYTLGPSLVLFLTYGLSSITSGYLLSFVFEKPFAAQTAVLLLNFVGGFLWPTVGEMLKDNALNVVKGLNAVFRLVPAVCFGESMYVLSGNQLAVMMMPDLEHSNLYVLLKFAWNERQQKYAYTGGIGTGLIYMYCIFIGCAIALFILEFFGLKRIIALFTRFCTSSKDKEEKKEDAEEAEREVNEEAAKTVLMEEERVCHAETGPGEDKIAVQHLRKRYFGTDSAAVKDLSLGVHEGEILSLLGLNGAGKTTTVSILAGETVRTSGHAYVNHVPAGSQASRSFVGYCPQYDPVIDRLSPAEHLYLYARIRGMREKYIKAEVEMLLTEMGLQPHRSQAAISLSGGNKRRLTLAISLVGRTTSILLDEPTAGMDALARAQTCAMVKQLTHEKSVILTTHLLDEVEALSDRVAFLAGGKLQCIGTSTELKGMYSTETDFTLEIVLEEGVDLIHDENKDEVVAKVVTFMRSEITKDGTGDPEKPYFCDLRETHIRSVRLTVRGDIGKITDAFAALRSGSVEGLPPVVYASVNQATLEDILLSN